MRNKKRIFKLLSKSFPNFNSTYIPPSYDEHCVGDYYMLENEKEKDEKYYMVIENYINEDTLPKRTMAWIKFAKKAEDEKRKLVLVVSNKCYETCQQTLKTWKLSPKTLVV